MALEQTLSPTLDRAKRWASCALKSGEVWHQKNQQAMGLSDACRLRMQLWLTAAHRIEVIARASEMGGMEADFSFLTKEETMTLMAQTDSLVSLYRDVTGDTRRQQQSVAA